MTVPNGRSARARAARLWASRRHFELDASVRFAELAHRLAEHGAQASVVSMAREASSDELRHADLCKALVEHFSGAAAPDLPAPLAVARIAPAHLAPRDALLYEVVALSCVTETLSTAVLAALVDAASDSLAQRTMHSILRDEVRHSRLGWAHLAACHSAGARDVVSPHLPAMLSATLGHDLLAPEPPGALDAALSGYGAVSLPLRRDITRSCFANVIFPGLERFGIDASAAEHWLSTHLPRA